MATISSPQGNTDLHIQNTRNKEGARQTEGGMRGMGGQGEERDQDGWEKGTGQRWMRGEN